MENNIPKVLTKLISAFSIPVTPQTVFDEVTKHPYYPSMLSISDALDKWKIPNGAYRLEFDELNEVPCPFIAHLAKDGGSFALVTKFSEQEIVVSNEEWNNKKIKPDTFKMLYAGTVLLAESAENSGEADFKKKLFTQKLNSLRIPFLLTAIAFVLLNRLLFHTEYGPAIPLSTLLLTIFKTGGLVISVLLLIQSIDANNALVQRLCGVGKKADCNAILSSSAAKLTNYLSWSEVGFFYFAGSWLVLLFNTGSVAQLQFLAIINLLSLPYTFYSIYYQVRVAKKWCVFCCCIQGLLWLEFFALLPAWQQSFRLMNYAELSTCLIGFAIPLAAWIFIKPFLVKANELKPVQIQLSRFKNNPDLFWSLLKEQPHYSLLSENDAILFGNKQAEHTITIVTNPYCMHCGKAHHILEEWLSETNAFKLQMIFSTNVQPNDPKVKVADHLMKIQAEKDEPRLKAALEDWFSQKYSNYELWAKNYPINNNEAADTEIGSLQKQREWCKLVGIEATPTIFIDGRKLPNTHQLEDIKYFI